MISYAQNCEDVLLERLFAEVAVGYYLDVGATDSRLPSVTKHFSRRGWRGVNVTFLPEAFYRLQQDRPRDVNLLAGVGAATGTLTVIEPAVEESRDDPLRCEHSPIRPPHHRSRGRGGPGERSIPVFTLWDLVQQYVREPVTFLVLSAPGREGEILSAAEVARWRPRAVVVEGPEQAMPDASAEWEAHLVAAGYRRGSGDGINQFWLREEDLFLIDRLREPVTSRDGVVRYSLVRTALLAASRGAALREREAAVAAKERVIRELTTALEERDETLANQDRLLREQAAALQRLDDSLHRQQHELGEKDDALHEALEQSRRLQIQLCEKDAALAAALEEEKSLARQLHEKEQALWEQIDEGRRLQAQLQDKHAALKGLQAEAARLQQELNEKEAALASKHAALVEALDDAQKLTSELQSKEEALQTACGQLQDLQQQLADKHAALHEALGWAEEYRQRLLKQPRRTAIDRGKSLLRQFCDLGQPYTLLERKPDSGGLHAMLHDNQARPEAALTEMRQLQEALKEKEAALASKHADLLDALAVAQQLNADLQAKEESLQAAWRQAQDLQRQLVDKHAALHQALGWVEDYRRRLHGVRQTDSPPSVPNDTDGSPSAVATASVSGPPHEQAA
jgi:hypothetical protein